MVAARVVGSVSASTTADLVCRTAFSFGEGASTPEEVVEQAATLGLGSVGITDRDGVYGLPRAHRMARSLGVRILPGALLTLSDGPGVALLARDAGGWANLTQLITEARRKMPKGWGQLPLGSLLERATGLEAILVGEWCAERANAIREAFGRHASLALTRRLDSHDDARWEHLSQFATHTQLPLVATCDALMHDPRRKPLQDVLTCIRKKCTVDQAGTALTANAMRFLRSPEAMGRMFKSAPQALERSTEIADRCHFSLDDLHYLYPREIVPEGWTPMSWLRHQTQEGLNWRYPEGVPPKVQAQVDHELTLIEKLRFPAYFLTVHDVVHFARARQILCQGRGSAATGCNGRRTQTG